MRFPLPFRRPARPRADPVRIALLEYELFGMPPAPGTVAAAIIGFQTLANLGAPMLRKVGGGLPPESA